MTRSALQLHRACVLVALLMQALTATAVRGDDGRSDHPPERVVAPTTAAAVLAQVESRHSISSEWTRVSMALRDRSGVDSVRLFVVLRVTDKAHGTQQWLRFDAPGDVKDLRILSAAAADAADHWVYSPKADKVRKVQAADADERVLDTDLSFADLLQKPWSTERLALADEVELDGHPCYRLVRAAPAVAGARQAPLELLVRKDIFVVVRVRIAGADGAPLKEVRATNLVRIGGDVWRADKVTVTDVRRGHRTTLFVQERRLDVEPPADLFDPRHLATSRLR